MTRFVILDTHAPRVVSESGPADDLRITLGREDISGHINEGLRFSNVDPGGFEICELTLPRDLRVPKGEAIRVTAGLAVAWEGRVSEVDHSLGQSAETRISGEGYGARLRDGDMSMIYVDRDLSAWEEMSDAWLTTQIANGNAMYSSEQRGGAEGIPALSTRFPGHWGNVLPRAAAMYDAGEGNEIEYVWLNPITEMLQAADYQFFSWNAALSDNANFNPVRFYTVEYPNAIYAFGDGKKARYTRVHFVRKGTLDGTVDDRFWGVHWRNLAVYGDHGLLLRGATNPGGLWPSDIVGHVIDRVSGVDRGTIGTASGFVVPHASYRAPVAHEQIVSDMNAYMGWHWGTWEKPGVLATGTPRFDFRPLPTARTAWAPRRDIDGLELAARLDSLHNRIRIAYQDPTGKRRFATGTAVVPELTALGLKRTLTLELGTSTSGAAALMVAVVAAMLAEQSGRVAGSGSVRGCVQTPAGPKPALLLRAGLDRFGVPDLPPSGSLLASGDNEFHVKRVETTVGREGPVTQVELGAGADLLEVLSARVESSTSVLGAGV